MLNVEKFDYTRAPRIQCNLYMIWIRLIACLQIIWTNDVWMVIICNSITSTTGLVL